MAAFDMDSGPWDHIMTGIMRREGVKVVWNTHYRPYSCPSHRHIGLEILLCTAGEGHFYLGEHRLPYQSGSLILFDPQLPHRVEMSNIYHRWAVCVWPDFFMHPGEERLFIEPYKRIHPGSGRAYRLTLQRDDTERLSRLMRDLDDEVTAKRPHHQEVLPLRLAELFLLIDRFRLERVATHSSTGIYSDEFGQMLTYIEENLFRGVSVAELAERYHWSSSQLYRVFRNVTGQTPSQYIRSRRVHKAKQLLTASSMTVTQVAEAVGIENVANFTRMFRDLTGTTPTQFRRQLQHSSKA